MKQRRPVSTTPTEASTSNPLALRIQRLVTLDNHVEYRVMRGAFPVKTFSSYDEAKAYVARQQAQS
jgi:hypothetical protein